MVEAFQKLELSFEFIYSLLARVDERFSPKLSTEFDLSDYAKKLQKRANCIIIEEKNGIVGFVFFYIIEPKQKSAYITLICSLVNGYGKNLYAEFLNKLPSQINEILLEVDRSNHQALKFYDKLGFNEDIGNSKSGKIYLKHQL